MTNTTHLQLPQIASAQAQKHVTHNEALLILDAVVQLAALDRDLAAPPGTPAEGDRYIVGASATGDWAGWDGDVALYSAGAWQRITPVEGWLAWIADEDVLLRHDGSAWAELLQNVAMLGINTTADATNRLAVSSPASLFSHEGAGHQLKVNKAADTDTASLLFQSNWTGHAEMGLAGDTAFSVKVSADGATWYDAIRADAGVQEITLSMPVTGSAVQSSANDITAGRLMKTKAFGIGLGQGEEPELSADLNDFGIPSGPSVYAGGATVNKPAANAGAVFVWRGEGSIGGVGEQHQFFGERLFSGVSTPSLYYRSVNAGGTWSDWGRLYHNANIVGAVAASAGKPTVTSAIVERGSNANGEYVRFADGTQICTIPNLTMGAITSPRGSIYVSVSNSDWTFPAAFLAGSRPVIGGEVNVSGVKAYWIIQRSTTPADYATTWRGRAACSESDATARTALLWAVGRWY